MPSATFTAAGPVQTFTAGPNGGSYVIVVDGAEGGASNGNLGGFGSEVSETVTLTPNEQLHISVGGAGAAGSGNGAGGGGGGSFVLANTGANGSFQIVLAAGGGGGASFLTAGGAGGGAGTASTMDGGAHGTGSGGGGGGGGFNQSGSTGTGGPMSGVSYAGGDAGGAGGSSGSSPGGMGGFGGGGGGAAGGESSGGGGGGGGFNGGAGGNLSAPGSGGLSFIAAGAGTITAGGAQATNMASSGVGRVTISNVACFVSGSRIRTTRGEVPVEALEVGDDAVLADGGVRRITWLGSRRLRAADNAEPLRTWPIRIRAGAFGEALPARDLLVSPFHAVCVDAPDPVFVPAQALVNGATVVREICEEVTYHHVQLDGGQEVILAEGLPTESYLDAGNRGFFAGEAGVTHLGAAPDGGRPGADPHEGFRHPWRERGPVVEALRARLGKQAEALGWTRSAGTVGLLVDGRRVAGRAAGLTVRFALPPGASTVRLQNDAVTSAECGPSDDLRWLGCRVERFVVEDGRQERRTVDVTDPRLCEGFHPAEDGSRWTDGDALIPPELWSGMSGAMILHVQLAEAVPVTWREPAQQGGVSRTLRPELALHIDSAA